MSKMMVKLIDERDRIWMDEQMINWRQGKLINWSTDEVNASWVKRIVDLKGYSSRSGSGGSSSSSSSSSDWLTPQVNCHTLSLCYNTAW